MGMTLASHVHIHPTAILEEDVHVGSGTTIGEYVLIREGATIGVHCTIRNDLAIGRFAKIETGSFVTASVPDFRFVSGNPASVSGYVCRCGNVLDTTLLCTSCGASYRVRKNAIVESPRT